MLSSQKLDVYFSLQQILLNTQDSAILLEKLFPKILDRIDTVGVSCQFMAAMFLNSQNQPNKTYFVDKNTSVDLTRSEINWLTISSNLKAWEKELFWKPIVIYKTINPDLVDSFITTYSDKKQVESLVVLPILISQKLAGIIIFATSDKNVEQEFVEFIELLTNLISIGYRLEDTQISLTKIGQQVYEMNAKLHDLDKLKDDFVSVASHELRTPMTAIKSYLWLALNKGDVQLSEKMTKYLNRGYISTERLINLVNDMLNVSRIEAGKIEIVPKIVDLGYLMEDIVSEIRPKADERGIAVNIIKSQIPRIFADPDKLYQIVLNLLGNAVKFTPNSGTITVSFFSDGTMVETAIKDSGVGISAVDISRLFQKFSRLDNSYVAAATSGGTGLGLFITKSLVEMMHGKIGAKSEGVGKGSTFYFTLPAATPDVVKNAAAFTVNVEGDVKTLEPTAF